MVLYPRSFLRGTWSGMASIIGTRQDKRYYWLLRPFTKVDRKMMSKKLKQLWLPSFRSKALDDERGSEDEVLWSQKCKMPTASDRRWPVSHGMTSMYRPDCAFIFWSAPQEPCLAPSLKIQVALLGNFAAKFRLLPRVSWSRQSQTKSN